ncbi:MAG: enoyl-CoA hydratase [Rhodospirillales bacterium]
MSEDKMLAEKKDGIGRLIFNNPERHNAVSLDMWNSAEKILQGFVDDDSIRVIVLAGAGGKSFVSGADISKFEKERSTPEAVLNYNTKVGLVNSFINNIPKPTIAEINGYCIGGGLGLAVSCDLRFCSEKSKFGLPAAKLGLGYAFENLKRLVDTIGPGAARDITFSGRQMDAEEALDVGIVQRVLAEGDLASFIIDYAKTVAGNAPLTVKSMKHIINETLKSESDRDLDACQRLVDEAFASDDYIEGRHAFMEKRAPQFKGK